jgi:hypothetical protein
MAKGAAPNSITERSIYPDSPLKADARGMCRQGFDRCVVGLRTSPARHARVIEACGWVYTTELIIWEKPGIGTGRTTRKSCETVWGSNRGRGLPVRDHGVRQKRCEAGIPRSPTRPTKRSSDFMAMCGGSTSSRARSDRAGPYGAARFNGAIRMILGVDPGLGGAIALLAPDGACVVHDLPTLGLVRGGRTKREIDAHALAGCSGGSRSISLVGRVGAMPGQSASSMFAMDKASGIVIGALAALGLPLTLIAPTTWKRAMQVPAAKDGGAGPCIATDAEQRRAKWARVTGSRITTAPKWLCSRSTARANCRATTAISTDVLNLPQKPEGDS